MIYTSYLLSIFYWSYSNTEFINNPIFYNVAIYIDKVFVNHDQDIYKSVFLAMEFIYQSEFRDFDILIINVLNSELWIYHYSNN